MRILAIGCHPDDVEIGCAGTLAQYKKQGHDVMICHVANGDKGHMEIPSDELCEIRKQEAIRAGLVIGAEVISLGIPDLEIYGDDRKSRDKMTDMIRYVRPDVIITHNPHDYMPDHLAVSQLVFAASFTATVPYYSTPNTVHGVMAPIYYMDTLAGIGFHPDEYVDISDTFELKLEMLNKHESQMKWMREHDGIDFEDFVRTVSKFRGLQCGSAYAEGFIPCRVWPKIVTKRLLP